MPSCLGGLALNLEYSRRMKSKKFLDMKRPDFYIEEYFKRVQNQTFNFPIWWWKTPDRCDHSRRISIGNCFCFEQTNLQFNRWLLRIQFECSKIKLFASDPWGYTICCRRREKLCSAKNWTEPIWNHEEYFVKCCGCYYLF